MSNRDINFKITVDGKEANATLTLTEDIIDEIINKSKKPIKPPVDVPKPLLNSLDGLNEKLSTLKKEFGSVEIGSKRFIELQTEIKKTETEIKKAGNEIEKIPSKFANFGNIITGINQGVDLFQKGLNVLSKPLEFAGQFESYETSLKVMLGSTELAKQRLQELTDFAASTPFEYPML